MLLCLSLVILLRVGQGWFTLSGTFWRSVRPFLILWGCFVRLFCKLSCCFKNCKSWRWAGTRLSMMILLRNGISFWKIWSIVGRFVCQGLCYVREKMHCWSFRGFVIVQMLRMLLLFMWGTWRWWEWLWICWVLRARFHPWRL